MDISTSTLWWIAAGTAVAAELASGTFFLLMIALGLGGGGVAAALGAGLVGQLLTAALLGGGAVALWSSRRARRPAALPAQSNPDVQTDIGSHIHVKHWQADGTARVRYRGADWTARWGGEGATPAGSGDHLVQAVQGNQLVLVPAATTRDLPASDARA